MIASNQLISTPTVEPPASWAAALRRWNIGLGFVHAVQAVAVLALATAFALPVTATFMEGPPGTAAGAPTTLFEVPVAGASPSSFCCRPHSTGSWRCLASSGATPPA